MCFIAETTEVKTIKTLFGTLKNMLTDLNIVMTKNRITIVGFSNSNDVLVDVVLNAIEFDNYKCIPEKIMICVNAQNLYKIISTASNKSTLSLFINDTDYNNGAIIHLGVMMDASINSIKLLEVDSNEFELPAINYTTAVKTSSNTLQKIIKRMDSVSDVITLSVVDNQIVMNASGDFASSMVNLPVEEGRMQPTSSSYEMKALKTVSKMYSSSENVEIEMQDKMPLILTYDIGTLGSVRFCISALPV